MEDIRKQPDAIVDLLSRLRGMANLYIIEALESRGVKGIVPAHGQILYPLFYAGNPVALGDLARRSGRAKSTITGMAHTLEKQGYIRRMSCPEDRRSVLVELTPEGRALKAVFIELSADLIRDIYKGVSPERQAELMRELLVLEENLSEVLSEKEKSEC